GPSRLAYRETPMVGRLAIIRATYSRKRLCAIWPHRGVQMAQRCFSASHKENPSSYFAVCARLLPSDVSISIQAQAPALDANDLQILRAIKQAVVDAGQREPNQVLQFTLDAVRSHNAKLITAK